MQPDPIGYADGMNMYSYVGGDPVNRADPSGLTDTIVVVGQRRNYCGPGAACFDSVMAMFSQPLIGRDSFASFGGGGGGASSNGPQSQTQQTNSEGDYTEIPLPGSNETNMTQCEARNSAAGYARDFQSQNNAELNVGLISRGEQWGYTNGITSWREGKAPSIPDSFVPSGATLRGSVHSHPDNFANSDWHAIPIMTSIDAIYALENGGDHYVVTPDGHVRRIKGFSGSNGYYVRSGTVTSCG